MISDKTFIEGGGTGFTTHFRCEKGVCEVYTRAPKKKMQVTRLNTISVAKDCQQTLFYKRERVVETI